MVKTRSRGRLSGDGRPRTLPDQQQDMASTSLASRAKICEARRVDAELCRQSVQGEGVSSEISLSGLPVCLLLRPGLLLPPSFLSPHAIHPHASSAQGPCQWTKGCHHDDDAPDHVMSTSSQARPLFCLSTPLPASHRIENEK